MGGKTQKSKRREREREKGEDLDNNRKDRREDNIERGYTATKEKIIIS